MSKFSEFYACKNISQPFLNRNITVHSDGVNELERGLVFADEVIDNAVGLCVKEGVVCKNFAFPACSLAFKESLDCRIIIQSAEQKNALRRGVMSLNIITGENGARPADSNSAFSVLSCFVRSLLMLLM